MDGPMDGWIDRGTAEFIRGKWEKDLWKKGGRPGALLGVLPPIFFNLNNGGWGGGEDEGRGFTEKPTAKRKENYVSV